MKSQFLKHLSDFANSLDRHVSDDSGDWSIKGFIDTYKNVYTISSDTKIVSKILEIHLFPKILEFAKSTGYKVVLAEHQNYYPDISLVKSDDPDVKFALDLKTTYRDQKKPQNCRGFTLGSAGKYFTDRSSTKNIQFPYGSYNGHFCLGAIYDRIPDTNNRETFTYDVEHLKSIPSVIKNIEFFAVEKWKIASDKLGSSNTRNIGSIQNINDLKNGNGIFSKLGEKWFDDYWMNYGQITIPVEKGTKKITSLQEFVEYRGGDSTMIVPKSNSSGKKST